MNYKKVASLCMLILPWVSVPLLGKKSFVRYLPPATFASLSMIILSLIANRNNWWKNRNPLFPKTPIDFTYILGAHFVTTLWVFTLTFGSFPLYLITNIILDCINAFPFAGLWKRLGFFKFKRMSPSIYWLITVLLAIFLYFYQHTLEKVVFNTNSSGY
ncbi:hypothetical protein [Metabacillus litoralis]|uniref:hypothetical protein n=1 Tax=Metabacillus litoralis TaxID=152268 RepID=UPI000EF59FF9|nr:hypothetical protein [Metabacillus litoralis]